MKVNNDWLEHELEIRRRVAGKMIRQGHITEAEYDVLLAEERCAFTEMLVESMGLPRGLHGAAHCDADAPHVVEGQQ